MANFPALKPTARSFQLGQYPVKTYRAMSGAVVRRSFGNKAFGYTLDLKFENVPEATVNTIIDHYNGQQGGTIGFAIATVFAGYSVTLQGKSAHTLLALNGSTLSRLALAASLLASAL
jgi:hypothetical protein